MYAPKYTYNMLIKRSLWQCPYHISYQTEISISARGPLGIRTDIGRELIRDVIWILPYHNLFIIYLQSQVSNKFISCPAKQIWISIENIHIWCGVCAIRYPYYTSGDIFLQHLSVSNTNRSLLTLKYFTQYVYFININNAFLIWNSYWNNGLFNSC